MGRGRAKNRGQGVGLWGEARRAVCGCLSLKRADRQTDRRAPAAGCVWSFSKACREVKGLTGPGPARHVCGGGGVCGCLEGCPFFVGLFGNTAVHTKDKALPAA